MKNNNDKGSVISIFLVGEPGTEKLADFSGDSCQESFDELGYTEP